MLVSLSSLKYLNLLDDPFVFFLRPDSCLANEIIFLFYFTLADVQLRLNIGMVEALMMEESYLQCTENEY